MAQNIETKSHAADKGQGMTIDELAAFVEHARLMGNDGTQSVIADVGFKGQVKALTVKPSKG